MDKDMVDKLKALACDSDRMVLEVLFLAREKTFTEYASDSSKAKLVEWQAAEKALKEKVDALSSVLFINPAGEPFKNLTGVFEFLKAAGYKVSKRKTYADAESGLIKMNPDRTINESEARAYAERFLKKVKSGNQDNGELDGIYKEKAAAELEYLKAKNEKIQFDLEKERGKYLLKTDVRTEFALKLGALDSIFRNIIRTRAADYAAIVGGNPGKTHLMVNLLYEGLDEALNGACSLEELEIELPAFLEGDDTKVAT